MKYMGSKARFAKELLPIILKGNENKSYVGPFAGGMNMIDKVKASYRYANDFNKYIVAMFREGANGWLPPENLTKIEYDDIRRSFIANETKYPDYAIGYVGIAASYSGKWFGGYAGLTKTCIGTERNYYAESRNNFIEQCKNLNGVWFNSDSYYNLEIPNNSVIYCDPPYAGTTKYKDEFDSVKFWDWVRAMSKEFPIFVSEYVAPDDFVCIWEKEAKSSLSANGQIGGNKTSIERLFVRK